MNIFLDNIYNDIYSKSGSSHEFILSFLQENQDEEEVSRSIRKFEGILLRTIDQVTSIEDLSFSWKKILGKKGFVVCLMKSLKSLNIERRKIRGILFNSVRDNLEQALKVSETRLTSSSLKKMLGSEEDDLTLPVYYHNNGVIHPLSQTLFELISTLHHMGFDIAGGPEIESDFNNFSALNLHLDHPARQEQDTFYMCSSSSKSYVLRTHVSPVQIRVMSSQTPPIRTIAFGRAYRSDYDRMHTPCFYQVEGLFIDKGVHMGHLKQCLTELFSKIFRNLPLIRFRPSFFPFTDPSAEMDVAYQAGAHNSDFNGSSDIQEWVEILGCGMVHTKVLERCGIDSKVYQGFAFGAGVDRIAMLKYGINDARDFYEGNAQWITRYGFSSSVAFL